jgi:capsular exopolysaccharide synthesis family protein
MSKIILALRQAREDMVRGTVMKEKFTDLLLSEDVRTHIGRRGSHHHRGKITRRLFSNADARDGSGQAFDEDSVSFFQKNTVVAEQYRRLVTEIFCRSQTRELRSVLVVSALSGEGKTLTATNIALTIAMNVKEQKVLLIDADFRNPNIHKMLGSRSQYGLSDYLLGEVEYSSVAVPTNIPSLTVINAGSSIKYGKLNLDSLKISEFFSHIVQKENYRYIIIDTSPIILTSEPMFLIPYVDSIIMVVRAGKTPKKIVSQAIECLGKEKILGCVFNGVSQNDMSMYKYHYDNSYYS